MRTVLLTRLVSPIVRIASDPLLRKVRFSGLIHGHVMCIWLDGFDSGWLKGPIMAN